MYPTSSQMFSIDDDENTLFLAIRIWVYSYSITEKPHVLKLEGRGGLGLCLELICSTHGLFQADCLAMVS